MSARACGLQDRRMLRRPRDRTSANRVGRFGRKAVLHQQRSGAPRRPETGGQQDADENEGAQSEQGAHERT